MNELRKAFLQQFEWNGAFHHAFSSKKNYQLTRWDAGETSASYITNIIYL